MGRAIDQLLYRHAPLRTAYELVIDAPVQRVRPHVVHELEVVDHSDLPAECIEKCICDGARALGTLPFVLGEGDLFRARLLHFDAQDHALLVATHHIAFDGSPSDLPARASGFVCQGRLSRSRRPQRSITPTSPHGSGIRGRRLRRRARLLEVSTWRRTSHARFPDRPSAAARAVEPGRARDIPSLPRCRLRWQISHVRKAPRSSWSSLPPSTCSWRDIPTRKTSWSDHPWPIDPRSRLRLLSAASSTPLSSAAT